MSKVLTKEIADEYPTVLDIYTPQKIFNSLSGFTWIDDAAAETLSKLRATFTLMA